MRKNKRKLLFLFFILLALNNLSAQNDVGKELNASKRNVTNQTSFSTQPSDGNKVYEGTVVDESGEPLIGVSVTLPGVDGFGVVTDVDGHFRMEVPVEKIKPNQQLTFSYIGMNSYTTRGGVKCEL